jgi:hypothetical protein
MADRVFLSHSSSDKDAVRRLAEDLKRAGVDVWLDVAEIKVGDWISRKIEQGLDDTRYLAIWLTKRAIESGWVDTEWRSKFQDEISNNSVVVLPLLADNCEIPRLLRGKRYADFRISYEAGLAQLLEAIGKQSFINDIDMEFKLILPGAFLMGSDLGEENERPVHQVSITRPFYISKFVVTQGQWRRVMNTTPWHSIDHVMEGEEYPAVNVVWYDAQQFLTRLGESDKNAYYLPTEEEWEYAARAGTTTAFKLR